MLLEIEKLTKTFPSADNTRTVVLDNLNFQIQNTKLLFLTGINGIGKTVFAKCISGLESYDNGVIKIDGQGKKIKSGFKSRQESIKLGIDYIPQELPKTESLSIAEFLSIGSLNKYFWSYKKIKQLYSDYSELVNLPNKLDLNRKLAELNFQYLQKLYILKSISKKFRLLFLDEPFAQLEKNEAKSLVASLMKIIDQRDCSIVIIAHPSQYKLKGNNVFYLDGKKFSNNVPTISIKKIQLFRPKHGFVHKINFCDTSIILNPSNILSIRCQGSTKEEISEFNKFANLLKTNTNKIITSKPIKVFKWNNNRRELKVGYIPFQGIEKCLVRDLSIGKNCLVNNWNNKAYTKAFIFYNIERIERHLFKPISDSVNLSPSDIDFKVGNLSGGNKQRLLVGRSFYSNPDLIIACNLFRGLDEEGVKQIYKLMTRKIIENSTSFILLSFGPKDQELIYEHLIADKNFLFQDNKLVKE